MSLVKSSLLLLSLASSALSSCAHGTYLSPRAETGAVPISTFSYDGLTGPLNWYAMNKTANKACFFGKNQTPVNVVSTDSKVIAGTDFKLNIPSVAEAEFENLGSTVEVIINGTFQHGGETYTVKQFHFHTPSEHNIDMEYSVLELHVVSQSASGQLSVAGFPIALGSSNSLLTNVFKNLADIKEPGTLTHTGPLSFSRLASHLSSNKVFRYAGSLTTPPCSEGVQWVFSLKPLTIDPATFARVQDVVKFNSRFLQGDLGATNLLENAFIEGSSS